jgi:hypothetical protein
MRDSLEVNPLGISTWRWFSFWSLRNWHHTFFLYQKQVRSMYVLLFCLYLDFFWSTISKELQEKSSTLRTRDVSILLWNNIHVSNPVSLLMHHNTIERAWESLQTRFDSQFLVLFLLLDIPSQTSVQIKRLVSLRQTNLTLRLKVMSKDLGCIVMIWQWESRGGYKNLWDIEFGHRKPQSKMWLKQRWVCVGKSESSKFFYELWFRKDPIFCKILELIHKAYMNTLHFLKCGHFDWKHVPGCRAFWIIAFPFNLGNVMRP